MSLEYVLFLSLLLLCSCQVFDIPSTQFLITPDYNERGFNRSGRYQEMWFPSFYQNHQYYIQRDTITQKVIPDTTREEYTYFIGPIRHGVQTPHDDQCIHGYKSGIAIGKNPLLGEYWQNGNFCENYLCKKLSGIYMSFMNRTHSNVDDLRIHASLINMCLSCEATSNQTSFVSLIESGQCTLDVPRADCGGNSKELMHVYNAINGFACYDWKYRRYYGRNDVVSTILMRIFVFYGSLVLILTILPLLLFTLIFIAFPGIVMTLHDLDRISMVYDVNSRFWPQIRRIFSLYNQSVLMLIIGELDLVFLCIIDILQTGKLYPYALFLNQVLIVGVFVNLVSILYRF